MPYQPNLEPIKLSAHVQDFFQNVNEGDFIIFNFGWILKIIRIKNTVVTFKFIRVNPIYFGETQLAYMPSPEEHEFHHHWFKFKDKPVYESFLKDNHDVMIDMDKFFALSKTDQFNSLWEESMVIAFERRLPLLKGIQKVLCDLSKGKWNQFMIWNLVEIMQDYPQMNTRFVQLSNSLQEHKLENSVVKTV